MEGRRRNPKNLGRAAAIVAEFGRAYAYKKARKRSFVTRYTLQVTSQNLMDMDLLVRSFGGGAYKHLYTHLWILTRKEDLLKVAKEALPLCDEGGLKRLAPLCQLANLHGLGPFPVLVSGAKDEAEPDAGDGVHLSGSERPPGSLLQDGEGGTASGQELPTPDRV